MSVNLREDMAEAKECCWNCGQSTKPGSGRFVNRIVSGDDFETRKENGAQFPAGEYLCAECDESFRDENEPLECPKCHNKEDFTEVRNGTGSYEITQNPLTGEKQYEFDQFSDGELDTYICDRCKEMFK